MNKNPVSTTIDLFTNEVKQTIKQHAIEVLYGKNSKEDIDRRKKEIQSFGIGGQNKNYLAMLDQAISDAAKERRSLIQNN